MIEDHRSFPLSAPFVSHFPFLGKRLHNFWIDCHELYKDSFSQRMTLSSSYLTCQTTTTPAYVWANKEVCKISAETN